MTPGWYALDRARVLRRIHELPIEPYAGGHTRTPGGAYRTLPVPCQGCLKVRTYNVCAHCCRCCSCPDRPRRGLS